MKNNGITGALPASYSTLTRITYLNFINNALTGPLPSSWSALTNMVQLDFTGNALTGGIPSSWSTMTAIAYLWVEFQNFFAIYTSKNLLNNSDLLWNSMVSVSIPFRGLKSLCIVRLLMFLIEESRSYLRIYHDFIASFLNKLTQYAVAANKTPLIIEFLT